MEEAKWYVVHTYSGYENKVKSNIEASVENLGMEDKILEASVPMEEVVEEKDGQKKTVQRKLFPGYVFIKMVMTDETWHVVRTTRGCTGFVGPSSDPVPLTDEEVNNMGVEQNVAPFEHEVGDRVRVTAGPLEDFVGEISEIDEEKRIVHVTVSMFGRMTPVELDFNQVEGI